MKKIVILDGKTLGNIDLEKLNEIGEVDYYEFTSEDEVSNRIKDANIILTNKVILNEDNTCFDFIPNDFFQKKQILIDFMKYLILLSLNEFNIEYFDEEFYPI